MLQPTMAGTGRLVGKTAVVTGGGSGIGRAVCRLFAKEGASVAVLDRNTSGCEETISLLSRNHDNEHCLVTVDVSSESDVVGSFKTVTNNIGKSDILVNGAGITQDQFLVKMSAKQFDDVIAVNLKGSFLMAREFVRSFTEPRPGSIINIASIVGKVGNVGQTNYSASKAGVIGMTKTMSLEFARQNIRSNAILPGFVQTPMTDAIPEQVMKKLLKAIPMQRQGYPEEIANACLFLASSESSYITGATLEVAGGIGL